MPSTCCCVPLCSVRGGHVFPKNVKLRNLWIKSIRRSPGALKFLWQPTEHSVVCDEHFVETDYIDVTARGKNNIMINLLVINLLVGLMHVICDMFNRSWKSGGKAMTQFSQFVSSFQPDLH